MAGRSESDYREVVFEREGKEPLHGFMRAVFSVSSIAMRLPGGETINVRFSRRRHSGRNAQLSDFGTPLVM
jgi:hypothetical protein